MAMKITFVVPGIPIAKQGDRSAIIKGKDGRTFIHHYQPKKIDNYAQIVRWEAARAKAANLGPDYAPPRDVPVAITARFYFLKPKVRMKKRTAGQDFPRIVKPDIDNLTKNLFDGLKGIFFHDDAQIWRENIEKWETDSDPRTEVEIEMPE